MDPTTSCNIHGKSITERNSIKCYLCQTKVHLKCDYMNYDTLRFPIKPGIATISEKKLFLFATIKNCMLYPLLCDRIYCNSNSIYLYVALKPPKNITYLFSKFNNFSSDINNSPESSVHLLS